MILFIFEGEKREPTLYKTIEHLFFPKDNQRIICSFGNNIYNLYKKMIPANSYESDFTEDVVSVLKESLKNHSTNPLKEIERVSDISEVYLFFDYDGHNQNKDNTLKPELLNKQLQELLSFFNDETGNGKLYINYPMVESIRYTKELPDSNYNSYKVELADISSFKKAVDDFSFYPNLDFVAFRIGKKNNKLHVPSSIPEIDEVKENWNLLKKQNLDKAKYLCKGTQIQLKIFETQLQDFITSQKFVSILNAFPLFLCEYFGE